MAILVLRNGKGSGAHGYSVQLVAAGGLLHLFHGCALSHLQGTRGPRSPRGARGAWIHCLQVNWALHFLLFDWLVIVLHLATVWKWGVD